MHPETEIDPTGVHRCFVHRSFLEHYKGCPTDLIPTVYDAPDGYQVKVISCGLPLVIGDWQIVHVVVTRIPIVPF
jgi:hypothetical protein